MAKNLLCTNWKSEKNNNERYGFFLQIVHLKKIQKYTKNSCNSIISKWATDLLHVFKDLNKHHQRKIYRWQGSTWKDAQHYMSLEN